ncbi:hypothetical protein FQR65_LT16017 [Abscondita terminalis]|nr:hypothetical protein FQR65_LT16017 [Abscondita terminalis]
MDSHDLSAFAHQEMAMFFVTPSSSTGSENLISLFLPAYVAFAVIPAMERGRPRYSGFWSQTNMRGCTFHNSGRGSCSQLLASSHKAGGRIYQGQCNVADLMIQRNTISLIQRCIFIISYQNIQAVDDECLYICCCVAIISASPDTTGIPAAISSLTTDSASPLRIRLSAQTNIGFPSPNNTFLGLAGGGSSSGVDLYSGTLQVSIPVLSLASREFTVPVSFSYTGSKGIRVQDYSGHVGLGWQLEAGGSVHAESSGAFPG